MFVLLTLLPKNAMSRAMGRFTSMRLPGPIQRAEIRLFAGLAGVAIEEAREQLRHEGGHGTPYIFDVERRSSTM